MYVKKKGNRFADPTSLSGCVAGPLKINHVQQFEFIRKRFLGFGKDSFISSWLVCMIFLILTTGQQQQGKHIKPHKYFSSDKISIEKS